MVRLRSRMKLSTTDFRSRFYLSWSTWGGEIKWRDNHNRPILQVDQMRRICHDIVLGLLYLHQQGIIHKDIKPANLLRTDDRKRRHLLSRLDSFVQGSKSRSSSSSLNHQFF
jgi:serine/threonine protein kinase